MPEEIQKHKRLLVRDLGRRRRSWREKEERGKRKRSRKKRRRRRRLGMKEIVF